MRFLKKLLKAAAISFALFAAGIVLAAVIYPDTDPPDWYSFAVVLVPFAVFIFILARNKPHSTKEDVPAPSLAPLADSSQATDSEVQYNEPVSPLSPSDPDSGKAARHSEQRNTFSAADFSNGFDSSVYPDDTLPDEDISPDDDFIGEGTAPHVEYPDFSGSFLHIAGLPLLIGTFCQVAHFPDHLYISSPSHRHTLSLDKVIDVSILPYKDILSLHKQLRDSAASSPAFQALDEAVKVSAKKKHLQAHTKFLVFTYTTGDKDTPHAIIFQLNDGNLRDAQRFVSGGHAKIRPKIDL